MYKVMTHNIICMSFSGSGFNDVPNSTSARFLIKSKHESYQIRDCMKCNLWMLEYGHAQEFVTVNIEKDIKESQFKVFCKSGNTDLSTVM